MSFVHVIVILAVAAAVLAVAYIAAPKGWRTVVFNAAWAAAVVIPDLINQLAGVDWPSLLGEHYGPAVAAGLAIGNIVLRFATTTPIGQKE
ncbi:hypothetical protein [Xanthobacter versatilis]|uniref:hypothetical protein n=1 Tax=Xanthobacter autotrophicus (strain ATCC BAA-1158 / Py2) TaxID=78245 RepID=UPI00372A60CB